MVNLKLNIFLTEADFCGPKFNLVVGMFPKRAEVGMGNEDEGKHCKYYHASQISEFTPE